MFLSSFATRSDPDRISNSNKWTLASDKADRAARYKTVEDIKVIYRLHFGSKLIDIKVSKVIEDDSNIIKYNNYFLNLQVLDIMRNHLWYLTGQMTPLALCDSGLSSGEIEELVREILKQPREEVKSGKPKFPVMIWSDTRPRLAYFMTPVSLLSAMKLLDQIC